MRAKNKMALLAVNAMLASCAITIAWAAPKKADIEPWANSETASAGQLKAAINQQPPALDIATGAEIPSEGYCDQPYVVKLPDGTWLCVMTTGKGHEGAGGQHVVSCRSSDQGATWEPHVDIEPADGPLASWAMPYLTDYGRVYVFYTYNAKNLKQVRASTRYARKRVDTLGEYTFKFSDDGGKTWSKQRWFIPVRETGIDRRNPYKGEVRFFWGVGKPIQHKNSMYLGFTKVETFGHNFIEKTEAFFLHSSNIETERDPDKLEWKTLPDGDDGLKSPKGPIASEVNLTSLSDGSLFCTYRTVAGHPCHAYSRDEGKTWTKTAFMTYGPGGPLVNHPRAANFVRKLTEGPYKGRYIYWFHNNKTKGWGGRNPAYLLGGTEVDGPGGKHIQWGEPVAVLYDRNLETRISYPDFIWDDGLYITETQKSIARVHRIPDELLRSLWDQPKAEQTPAGDAPNVVLIFADDIGYEGLGAYGGLDFKTPHLDQMAKEGLRFQSMYTSSICTPSRVSLHTGTYTFRHKHTNILPVHRGTKQKFDFRKMPTFGQQIQKNGYMTAVTGKWQLATLEHWPNHIRDAGFDSWCIWQIWRRGKKTERHWNPTLNRDGKVMDGLEKRFGPDVLADYVIEKMTEATKVKKPFFIVHNELLPHWPLVKTPQDRALNREASMGNMIEYMDILVGRILRSIDELGIKENTYVFFMGDNGLQESYHNNPRYGQPGEKKHTRHTLRGNVDGGKSDLNDAGSHVPFIVWGPKSIPAGGVNQELVDVVDLFETFCELTATKHKVGTDGRSIVNQIHGKQGPTRRWVHQGLPQGESIFDGEWRYLIKSEKLIDARQLPKERELKGAELVERKDIIDRMTGLYNQIRSNGPAGE